LKKRKRKRKEKEVIATLIFFLEIRVFQMMKHFGSQFKEQRKIRNCSKKSNAL
jgi:hypothetical protein